MGIVKETNGNVCSTKVFNDADDSKLELGIYVEKNDSLCTIKVDGRLNTTTAPELEKALGESLNGVTELIFDLATLEYCSSAGLRVLLSAQKTMNAKGSMKVVNVLPEVKEVFEVTGFTDILTIE